MLTEQELRAQGFPEKQIHFIVHGTPQNTIEMLDDINEKVSHIEVRTLQIKQLVMIGLETPNVEHKQWFLEEIAKKLAIKRSAIRDRESIIGVPLDG